MLWQVWWHAADEERENSRFGWKRGFREILSGRCRTRTSLGNPDRATVDPCGGPILGDWVGQLRCSRCA